MTRRGTTRAGRRIAVCCAALLLVALAFAPSALAASGGSGSQVAASGDPFARQGMWIWYVSRSSGGKLASIIGRARRSDIGTVYVKAGDGSDSWGQFSRYLVSRLHQGGIDVCAWQFVYGDHPAAEARVGAAAVAKGADCLVIDAEGNYEGKYAAADRYVRALRARIGAGFPLSLAGFPYVDYHPSFPYSVFLGPGAATFSQPQMYWKAIGTTVAGVYSHTYLFNRVYGRPIYPLGQTYLNPGPRQLKGFRRYANAYAAGGVSWWSWQETNTREWSALGAGIAGVPGFRASFSHPILARARARAGISRGDLVVWAQQHLIAAGQSVPVTGIFGNRTFAAVKAFQAANGLLVDGVVGTVTWRALLQRTPVRIRWAGRRSSASASSARRSRQTPAAPISARLPARAYEIDPGPRP
jgi:Putative peptidoglycan binding domain